LPPALSPGERTVGQLVAESIRLYGRRVWPSFAIGLAVASANVLAIGVSGAWRLALLPVGAALLAAALVAACGIAAARRLSRDRARRAFAVGFVVFLPFPLLTSVYVLPGLVWLAFVGFSVPAAALEGTGFAASLRRGLQLGRADAVHALGGLATLAIVVFLTQAALFAALRVQGEQAALAAALLAGVVVSPLLFLGTALLYFDQAARVGSRSRRTSSRRTPDADLPDADDAHREGRPDAQVQSGPPA
jgi:threonine/homoserine/homoserine lactone efflux protein